MKEESAYAYYNELSPQKQAELDDMYKREKARGGSLSFRDFMADYFGRNFDDGTYQHKSGGVTGTYGTGTNTRDDMCSRW